jgi:ankyrin repeat protein
MDASRSNAVEMVDFLVSQWKANCDAMDCLGRLPSHHAAQSGSRDVLESLIKYRADIQCAAGSNGMTPLHYAAKEGHCHVICCLLDAGVDVNSKDKKGRTALHMASSGGYAGCVDVLLNTYSATDCRDKSGKTAFDLARNDVVAGLFWTSI